MKPNLNAIICMLAIVMACMSPHAAQARPGTPTDLRIFQCDPSFRDKGNAYYHPSPNHYDNPPLPGLCITFRNTAPERVVFEYQMNSNGAVINHAALHYDCLHGYAQAYSCVSASNFGGDSIPFAERNKDNPEWWSEGFQIKDLDFQRQYCVRVRTRDYSGPASGALAKPLSEQEVSLDWSGWACAVTSAMPVRPPPPPKPVAPKLSVSITKRGDKVTATWQGANYVGYYTIGAKPACTGTNAPLLPPEMQGQVSDGAYTFTLNVSWADAMDMADNAYIYRICAHNDSGAACSDWESSVPGLPQCVQTHKLTQSPAARPSLPKTRGELEVTQTPRAPLDRVIGASSREASAEPGRVGRPGSGPIMGEPGGFAGPAPAMTGVFDTDFGVLQITKSGGTYGYKNGQLTIAKIFGDFMEGTWTQSGSNQRCSDGAYRGTFRFRFTKEGFTGAFGYCDAPPGSGTWNGKRRATSSLRVPIH